MKSVTREFEFKCEGRSDSVIRVPVTIPLPPLVNFREVGYRIMKNGSVAIFNQDKLMKELYDFIQEETEKFEDEEVDEEERKEVCSRFSTILRSLNQQKKLSDENEESSELSLWQMYHKIIHSGFLTEPLVTLEHSFSVLIREVIESRDQLVQEVTDRQSHEMEEMLKRVSSGASSVDDVNRLSITHFAELDDEKKKWERSLNDLKEAQKEEFTGWIRTVYKDLTEGKTEEIVAKIRTRTESSLQKSIDYDLQSIDTLSSDEVSSNLMDESFTINLGAQLKTTHNLRLISCNILDLCRNRFAASISLPTPQRIQTAMSMYSNHLSGLVLLVDNRVNSYSGVKKEFASVCEQSTDFHFPSLEQQLENIRSELQTRSDNSSNSSSTSLKVGDFYTTKHSNLSEVHVVFHLVTDESIHSSDISSRHPLVLGLRNILRTAHLSEVSTISLPLLLTHEMSENMTLAWCLRRAELVFKCMKGFMIEMASLTPSNDGNRTVKFVLPEVRSLLFNLWRSFQSLEIFTFQTLAITTETYFVYFTGYSRTTILQPCINVTFHLSSFQSTILEIILF